LQINQAINRRRLELGLTIDQAAIAAGLGESEYLDMELYPDEALSVATLGQLRATCRALELDLAQLLTIGERPVEAYPEEYRGNPRDKILRERRQSCGMSPNELSEKLGFKEIVVEQMETDPDFLEGWSVELVRTLASTLGLPQEILLLPVPRA